ncbi:MAG: DUF2283 domain-containing protein [SAR324 cluster bacterium]|nr:DUF2283 domain-containing protein [SAR324 cluster bacterium]
MKIYYDREVDALYLQLAEATPEGVDEIEEGIHADLTPEGHLVGIEILKASKRLDLKTLLSYSLEGDVAVAATG